MAYLPQQDKEENKVQGQESNTNENVLAQGQTSGIGEGSAQQQNSDKKGTSSGAFTNLNSYLDANQGEGERMGQAMGGTIQNTANEAQGKAAGVKQQVQSATDTVNKDLSGANQIKDSLFTDPASIDKDQFNNLYNYSYQGPSSLQDLSGVNETQKAFKDTQQLSDLATKGGQAGRGEILDRTYGNKAYSAGEQGLDSFIMNASRDGQQQLQNIASQYGDYNEQFSSLSNLLGDQLSSNQQLAESTVGGLRDAYGQAVSSYDPKIAEATSLASQTNLQNQQKLQDINSSLANNNYQQAADLLGVSAEDVQYAMKHGIDPTRYLTQYGNVSAGDYLDANDANNYSSLLGLLGESIDPSLQATGVDPSGYDFNQDAFNALLSSMRNSDAAMKSLASQTSSGPGFGVVSTNQIRPVPFSPTIEGIGQDGANWQTPDYSDVDYRDIRQVSGDPSDSPDFTSVPGVNPNYQPLDIPDTLDVDPDEAAAATQDASYNSLEKLLGSFK